MGNYELAKIYAERALVIANEVGAMIIKKDAYKQLSLTHEGLTDLKKALKYHKIFIISQFSVFIGSDFFNLSIKSFLC